MLNKNSKIFVAGHNGMVGSSILNKLKKYGYKNLLIRNKVQLDLRNQKQVSNFFLKTKPDYVIIAAAKVGGIYANSKYPTEFIYDNLQIQNNIIFSSLKNKVKDLIFLGSSCIYPKFCKQPIKEEYLLSGKLEETNDAYAVAKIAGIKLCEKINLQYNLNYKCLMPSNSYGPNDNYDDFNSHFLPALIKKVNYAKNKKRKKIILWGSGEPRREMIFSDDIADACFYFLGKKTKDFLINIGSGKDMKIKQYAKKIMKILDVNFKIEYDRSKPDGTPKKLLDVSIAKKYGWKFKTSLDDGLKITINDYLKNNVK